jgi:hypothetical protein
MKMKKQVLLALFATVSYSALYSQSGHVKAGINLANVSVNSNGRVDDANSLTSFQVGIVGDFDLAGDLITLQPGILFTGKGSKVQRGTAGQAGYFQQTFNPRYIEVPVNLVFKAPLGNSSRLFAGAGPYLAVGVGGKSKTEGTRAVLGNYSIEQDIRFSNDDPTTFNQEEGTGLNVVKRFDYGFNGTAGLEGKSIVLGVNYGLGLAKLQSGTNNNQDNNNKHRVLSFTLGFKF